MARDGLSWAIRATIPVASDKSGTLSNTFNFMWTKPGAPIVTDLDYLCGVVQAFYNTPPSGTDKVAQFLGPAASRGTNLCETAAYNLDLLDSEHYYGSPVDVLPFTLAASMGGNGLPAECAATISYRADYSTDPEHAGTQRPRAQDRGRLYLGPLHIQSVQDNTTPSGQKITVLADAFVAVMKQAANRLIGSTALHTAGWKFAVWSRHDQMLKEVAWYAVDSSPDSQRRRGIDTGLLTWNFRSPVA